MARKLLNVYLVTRTDEVDYEEDEAMVIIAATPGDAREFAGTGVWHQPSTTVEHVGKALPDAKGGVVLVANRGA